MPDTRDIRKKMLQRHGELKSERSSWINHWTEISTYLLPRSGRFFQSQQNKGHRVHNNIYDNTGVKALRTMAAGMMAGATSPARPWFRLATPDPELNQYQSVKVWLDDVTKRMHSVFQRSNTYRALHQLYEELGAFGTGASIILQDYDSVIHHYPLTIGEYCIATDAKGNVCTLFREFEMQVSQMVKEFGLKNCSTIVQNLYNEGKGLDKWIPIVHAIEPRADRDTTKRDAKNMPWCSYYFELGVDEGTMLRESGFKQFPAVVPRWALAGGDIYGNSPGMEALGDIKQLQHEQLRKANAIDFQSNPPLQVPTSLKNQDVNRLPGGITYVDASSPNGAIKSAFDVTLRLDYLLEDIRDVRGRINSSFFADLFLMISQQPADGTMTATEVAERHEEKLLMLGPVLERLNNELLYPMVETTFAHMIEGGAVPPAPEELQGMDLQVEFVSMLAQAQRAIGTNSIDRFVGNLGVVAQMKPDVLDKFDADKWAEGYSDMLGVDPNMIVSGDKVAIIRDARNKAQAAQAQAATMEQATKAAKNLATSPTGEPNALQDMMNQFSGYGSPSAVEV
jgi:hypothetical protein